MTAHTRKVRAEPSPEDASVTSPESAEENVTAPDAGDEAPSPGAVDEPASGAESASDSVEPQAEERADYKDRWLRAEAELQNYKRRSQRDREEAERFAEERVLLDVISFLDDLERALDTAREAETSDAWVVGVRLTTNRMVDSLSRHGVTPDDPVGQPFDPEFHEALLEIDAPEGTSPGHVVEVVRKGYRRNQRALRAARVVVARRAPEGEIEE